MSSLKKIAVMTSGGDSPGMNAFIRAATRHALAQGLEVYGINEGYQGMIENNIFQMEYDTVCNIIQRGGTMLKTARSMEFKTPEGRAKAAANLDALGIDAVICCGGDGSYKGLHALANPEDGAWDGLVIGTPGTIDNDIAHTDYTIGFDTAINTAMEAIDKLRDTGDSHDMHFIVEVMGRHCGDIAEAVGLASGSNNVLVPGVDEDINVIIDKIHDKGHDIIVVAEGDESGGGFGLAMRINAALNQKQDYTKSKPNFRICVLGHIQRGGSPTARDRILADQMAVKGVDSLIAGETLQAVAIQKEEYVLTALK